MNLKAPTNPLPVGYRPPGADAHKVTEKDSWWTLAASRPVDPWWLIQYNFETRDPAEVNWYLKNRVGCMKTTANGQNYVFSSNDNPGIVYLPTPQTLRNLKNMTFGKFGITIAGDEDYQMQVSTTLQWLARSDTGMTLLNAIGRTGKQIVISPYTGSDCNATAAPTNSADSTAAGTPVLNRGKQVMEPDLLREVLGLPLEPVFGTGAGSNADVKFSPTIFGYGVTGACSSMAGSPGASPSQVLFHELAHAYRNVRGASNRRPTIGGSASYTNLEEFFAVVLSNVLIADPTYSSGNRTLRADHWGFQALAPHLCTSKGFVSHTPNRNLMRELVQSEPQLAKDLAAGKSYFNPFGEAL